MPLQTHTAAVSGPGARPHGFRRRTKSLLIAGMVVLVACVDSCNPGTFPLLADMPSNFHVVDEARLYRSGQPDESQLKAVIAEFGIRTVLNLRGTNTGTPWYDTESRVCQESGVTLVDYSMSAQSLPPPEMMGGILKTLATAEYPMLMHCESGSDRTGAISAIYRMSVLGDDKSSSLQELSFEYLHLRAFRPCMDALADSFDTAPDWLTRYASIATQPCPP